MNIHISLKFHAVCAASKVLQNYNDLGLKGIYTVLPYCVIYNIYKVIKTRKIHVILTSPCSEGSQTSPSTCENSESEIVSQSDAFLESECCKIPAAFD